MLEKKIKSLGGSLLFDTVSGRGSAVQIRLPLLRRVIDAMVARIGEHQFVIPLSQISELILPKKNQFFTYTSIGPCLLVREKAFPILDISSKLKVKLDETPNEEKVVVMISSRDLRYVILVDEILKEQQVVIRKIDRKMKRMKGVMGSTVIDGERPAFILDLDELYEME